ncbi:YbaB/EbfC family nucleoid-associated protein [Actinopolyspora halophila]|uniref:YbaB/EbfC family nucleoid-associated protein n=1 Tax=Actinopolyspora halophila TaxID=1850 RepID=UPI0003701FDD|nr:YbaB/EbfC family nucleoid-associated protein [Actinopolyspora halophila]
MTSEGFRREMPDLNSALEVFEEEQRKLAEFQRKLAETTTVVDAPKKLFTVTLDGNGELTELKFNTTGYRSMPPAELSALITETLQKARRQSLETMQELMGSPMGGADLNDLASGQADLADVLGKVMEPSLDLVREANGDSPSKDTDRTEDDGWDRD